MFPNCVYAVPEFALNSTLSNVASCIPHSICNLTDCFSQAECKTSFWDKTQHLRENTICMKMHCPKLIQDWFYRPLMQPNGIHFRINLHLNWLWTEGEGTKKADLPLEASGHHRIHPYYFQSDLCVTHWKTTGLSIEQKKTRINLSFPKCSKGETLTS